MLISSRAHTHTHCTTHAHTRTHATIHSRVPARPHARTHTHTHMAHTQAMQAAPAIFVPQFLFAGFFVKLSQIPVWIRWAQYLCSLKFGINLLMINEFGGDRFPALVAQP